MNLYFLMEDSKSSKKTIEKWIPILIPSMELVKREADVDDNKFIVYTAGGYPSVLGIDDSAPERNRLGNTIDNINSTDKFDYLIIILDCDDECPDIIKEEAYRRINNYKNKLNDRCKCKVFVQNKCFETWLLGYRDLMNHLDINKKDYEAFIQYLNHYDVSEENPELLEKPEGYRKTTAKYHEEYLRFYFLASVGLTYKKGKVPNIVYEECYVNSLKNRIEETGHLNSLKEFFDFIDEISRELLDA